MKSITLIFWILLILTSCYSNPKDLALAEGIEKNNLEEKQFIFEKNKECYSLNEEVRQKKQKDFIDCGTVEILEWFYSPSINSCIHWMRTEIINCSTFENKYWEYFLTIKDYYSNRNIITFPCTIWLDDWCETDYQNKINELKK